MATNWLTRGRDLIIAQSDGRTETSARLTPAEVERIITLLRQEQKSAGIAPPRLPVSTPAAPCKPGQAD